MCGAEAWTLWKIHCKHLGRLRMWCWRRKEISWTDRVKNEVLHEVMEERNILHTIKQRKANWTGYNLHGDCLLRHVVEVNIYIRKGRSDGKTRKKT